MALQRDFVPLSGLWWEDGITSVAFGDLFLQEVRDYRTQQMRGTGLEPLFPVWQISTAQLAGEMIASGLKAKIACVDPSKLGNCFAGRDYDLQSLQDLPSNINQCAKTVNFIKTGIRIRVPLKPSRITLNHRTHPITVALKGDCVSAMQNFGARLTYFDPLS